MLLPKCNYNIYFNAPKIQIATVAVTNNFKSRWFESSSVSILIRKRSNSKLLEMSQWPNRSSKVTELDPTWMGFTPAEELTYPKLINLIESPLSRLHWPYNQNRCNCITVIVFVVIYQFLATNTTSTTTPTNGTRCRWHDSCDGNKINKINISFKM